jgi:hypothetical protein
VLLDGKLTPEGFAKVMSLIEIPAPGSTELSSAGNHMPPSVPPPAPANQASTPGASAAPADPQAATITASQAYFKAISVTLDSFSQPTSVGAGAAWLKRAATRIDHLPMLNVDPELLQWGSSVSASLLDCAQQLAVGQAQISSRTAGAYGANVPGSAYNQDSNGNYQFRADAARQSAAMRQASQEERARVTAPVNKLLADTIATRGKMRATLVGRYKAEF